jgi:GH43 family beta-xylosidase
MTAKTYKNCHEYLAAVSKASGETFTIETIAAAEELWEAAFDAGKREAERQLEMKRDIMNALEEKYGKHFTFKDVASNGLPASQRKNKIKEILNHDMFSMLNVYDEPLIGKWCDEVKLMLENLLEEK